MRDLTHIADEKTAETVKNLMRQEKDIDAEAAQKKEAKEIANYYKEHFDFVQLVQCEKCGSDLCLWVLDRDQVQANMVNHHLGLRRIVIGNSLLASRKRLDGAMGYQCGGATTNPAYEAHVNEVQAFNDAQDKLASEEKDYEEHREITEPATFTCESDSRLSPIEKGIIEEEPYMGTIPSIDPHVEAKIKQKIVATNFKPEVKDLDKGVTSIEGFKHTTLKG